MLIINIDKKDKEETSLYSNNGLLMDEKNKSIQGTDLGIKIPKPTQRPI